MSTVTQGLRPRKDIRFNNELVEINSVWLACSGIRRPGYKLSFNYPGEGSYIDDLKVRTINDKQDIYDVLDNTIIDKICNKLIDQVEEPYQERED